MGTGCYKFCTNNCGSGRRDRMLDTEKLTQAILYGIEATSGKDDYSVGMRNGMRWVLSMITNDADPEFERTVKNENNSHVGR